MTRLRLRPVLEWLRRVVTQPQDELDRWEVALRFGYDLGRYGARQLRQDRAPQMSGALAFRTLFGLLPVLVVGTVLVRALKGDQQFGELVKDLLTRWGLYEIVSPSMGAIAGEAGGLSLGDFLEGLFAQAANLNLAALGWVGLAVLIYAAIGLMVTIENSFNTIYRAPEGRAWLRRVPVYWTVLTAWPMAVGLTMYVNKLFGHWIGAVDTWQWMLGVAPLLWSFVVTWFVMAAIYRLVPNTHVSLRPALTGAFVAAILMEIGRETMGAYLQNALSIKQLYGPLGLIPLFMFWVYLMWLVVLFGLEVSATLQMLGGRRRLDEIEQKRQLTGIVDPASVLTVMQVIAEGFQSSQPTTARQIADATSLPEATVLQMLEYLISEGFLHRLDQEDAAVALARPPQRISADQLIDIGFTMVDEGRTGRRSAIVQRLREAQRSLAGRVTLDALATSGTSADAPDQAVAE